MNNEILVISAPSGSGKSSVIHELLDRYDSYVFSISTTTRPLRAGEVEGVDYYFTNREDFQNLVDQDNFIEWAEVHTNLYGTTKKEIDRIKGLEKTPILDVDVQGVVQLKSKLSNANYVMIVPPSREELEKRLRGRGNTADSDIVVRLANARKELEQYHHFDYIVANKELDLSVRTVHTVRSTERYTVENMKQTVEELLEEFNDYPS